MKSHELANALSTLARVLKSGPDVELSHLKFKETLLGIDNPQGLAVNLATLVSLASVDKTKWLGLIHEHGFPIDVRPRDGSRDILGKLFAYLENNVEAQERLKASVRRPSETAAPELMRALATLLKN